MVYPMAPWPAQNKHFSFLTFSILFFLAIFYFTKHILEPNLSNYRDLWLQTLPLSSIFSKRPTLPNQIYQTTHQPLPSPSPSEGPIVSLSPHEAPHSQISEEGFSHSAVNGSQASDISKEEDGVVNKKRESSSVGLVSTGTWEKCNIYDGTWVRDDGYPLYQPGSCPYVDDAYNCNANGRRDLYYMKWRWKPHGCEIPRFNATDFLERLRGKRLMLVGDSMNRNQFESMLCLLYEALPNKSRMYETRGYKITKGRGYFIFRFEDYDCTVEFVRSHFLVKEGTHLTSKGKSRPNLSIDRIDKSANRWKHADILIFNTGHWWTHGKTARGIDYYQEGDYIYPQFDSLEAFKKSMRTWGRWIEKNTNPAKNLVFYRGYSTAHFRGGDWDSGGSCNGETEPIVTGPILDNYPVKMKILEEVMQEIRTPVILLNVTKLTNFRKDGHPSFYGKKFTEGRKLSSKAQDCSHWCLPGIPDAWNELIYANLVMRKLPWKSGIKKSTQTLTTR